MEYVKNPGERCAFEVMNPVAGRLAKVLKRERKRFSNAYLVLYTASILHVLDELVNEPGSHLYTAEAPLFRPDPKDGDSPGYSVPILDTAAIMDEYDSRGGSDDLGAAGGVKDGKTGFYLPKVFMHYLSSTIRMAESRGKTLTLLGIGIQGFTRFEKNGTDGQEDSLLRKAAETIRNNIREFSDLPFTMGQGNFIVILPDTAVEQTTALLNRLFGAAADRFPLCAAAVEYRRGWTADQLVRYLRAALKEVFRLPAPTYGIHDGERVEIRQV